MPRLSLVMCVVLALGGCCVNQVNGIETASSASTGGSTTGSASSSGSTSAGSSTSSSSTSGTTTGITKLPPLELVDAGPDTLFGPVALAAIPGPSASGAARVVYSFGDGGQYEVVAQTLSGDGGILGDSIAVTVTGQLFSPPQVAVSDDGTTATICWPDVGVSTNPYGDCAADRGADLLCSSLSESGGNLESIYSNCGGMPTLAFNPSDGTTRLFFVGFPGEYEESVEEWEVGPNWAASATLFGAADGTASAPLGPGNDVLLLTKPAMGPLGTAGLYAIQNLYDGGDEFSAETALVDPNYRVNGGIPDSFIAAADLKSGFLTILELRSGLLQELTYKPSDDQHPRVTAIPIFSQQPVEGAIAVGLCPNNFVYLATTIYGTVLFAPATFDGALLPAKSRYFSLEGFDQTPGLNRYNGLLWPSPATSIATAPSPDGNLFLAISNPWQVGVYLVSCD